VITITKPTYKCEYCRKLYQRKRYCELHEPKCRKNPENYQACLDGCQFIMKKNTTVYYDTYIGQGEFKIDLLFCEAKNEFVYPYWVNGIDEADIEDGLPNNPMPKQCERWVNETI